MAEVDFGHDGQSAAYRHWCAAKAALGSQCGRSVTDCGGGDHYFLLLCAIVAAGRSKVGMVDT